MNKSYLVTFLVASLITFNVKTVYSQHHNIKRNNVKVEIGQGIFDGTHAKISYQADKLSIGAGYGMLKNFYPYEDGKAEAVFVSGNMYFGKLNSFYKYNTYAYLDIYHIRYEQLIKTNYIYPFSLGLGKDFFFTQDFGINIQGGAFFTFLGKVKTKYDIVEEKFWFYPIMPELSVRLYLKI